MVDSLYLLGRLAIYYLQTNKNPHGITSWIDTTNDMSVSFFPRKHSGTLDDRHILFRTYRLQNVLMEQLIIVLSEGALDKSLESRMRMPYTGGFRFLKISGDRFLFLLFLSPMILKHFS